MTNRSTDDANLKKLTEFLDEYCSKEAILPGTQEHEARAETIMSLWNAGFDLTAIAELMAASRKR